MTGWEVERTTRTACPAVAPVGARTPMPPLSQGAERRTRRTRWGLRALVVGGLAGAAWLLTGSAAQAADHDATPGALPGPSLIGAVVSGDTAPPVVDRILTVAAQPLDHHRTAQERPPAEVPVETLDEVLPSGTTDADSTLGAVDRVVREISGPLRLTGGPADSQPLAPVAVPITRTLRPVTDLLHDAAPATAHRPAPADVPAADGATPRPRPAVPAADEAAQTPVRDVPADEAPAEAAAAPEAAATDTGATEIAATRRAAQLAAAETAAITAGAGRHAVAVPAAAPDTVRHTTPGGDGPAPLQVHIGASGISTSASGAPTEGGSAAYLPATVAADPVAHRSPNATDVGARRHDAEAPTVSPD